MIYRYNDMATYIVSPNINIDWGVSYIYSFLSKYISIITVNDIFSLLMVLLALYFSYRLFVKIGISRQVSLVFGCHYALSNFLIFRFISFTPGLYPIFVFPLYFSLLLSKTRPVILALVSFTVLLFSNYFGYFLLLLTFFWWLYELTVERIHVGTVIKKGLIFSLIYVIPLFLLFPDTIFSNLPLFGKYNSNATSNSITGKELTVKRSIEDWYNLSFRPWYFVVPPKTSLFFGGFSNNIHAKIKDTGNYLADDYMEEEMAGAYMGWHFITIFIIVLGVLTAKRVFGKEYKVFESLYKNDRLLYTVIFLSFCILLVSGPPQITLNGINIYTPTYLLYKIVPVFRTLVRWEVVLYLFILVISAVFINSIYLSIKKNNIRAILLLLLSILSFILLAVKIPFVDVNNPPTEISFLAREFPTPVKYAVYPRGNYFNVFWGVVHKDILLNHVETVSVKENDDSADFSRSLVTINGAEELRKRGASYLIYYKSRISEKDVLSISKLNSNITSRDDLESTFTSFFGEPVFAQNDVYIYKVTK